MQDYQIYLLDGSNKISGACWHEAECIEDVIDFASEQLVGDCEIWLGAERVAVVKAVQPTWQVASVSTC